MPLFLKTGIIYQNCLYYSLGMPFFLISLKLHSFCEAIPNLFPMVIWDSREVLDMYVYVSSKHITNEHPMLTTVILQVILAYLLLICFLFFIDLNWLFHLVAWMSRSACFLSYSVPCVVQLENWQLLTSLL